MGMKNKIIAVGIMALASGAMAQVPIDGSHYAAGSHGIKGGSTPGPGIYLEDHNLFYTGTSDQLTDYHTFVYVQAPQLTWITPWTFLDASLGMDVEVPYEYREISYKTLPPNGNPFNPPFSDNQDGLGDIKLEPLILGWHWKHFDTTLAYSLYVPSGEFNPGTLDNVGDGEWANMISLGGVWYPDEKKTWAVSLLHHYEINSSQFGLSTGGPTPFYQKVPCSVYTLEWAVSKTILDNTDVGVFGYYQKQFTDGGATVTFGDAEVAGIGPEISTSIPGWGFSASVRYAYEFTAYHRPEGHTVNLTLTKKF